MIWTITKQTIYSICMADVRTFVGVNYQLKMRSPNGGACV